jgi:hypothetical protein
MQNGDTHPDTGSGPTMGALLPLRRTLTRCCGFPKIVGPLCGPDVFPSKAIEKFRPIEDGTIALEDVDDGYLFFP